MSETDPIERTKMQKALDEAIRTVMEREIALPGLKGKSAPEIADYTARTQRMRDIRDNLEAQLAPTEDSGMIAMTTELMMSNWSETASGGRKVEFWLPEDPEEPAEHPFKHFSRRMRGTVGTRFQAVLVEIDDEGKPIPRASHRLISGDQKHGGAISKHAGRLCKDSEFHAYLETTGVLSKDNSDTEKANLATAFVREQCGVDSRRLLDHERPAQLKYERLVSGYNQWAGVEGGIGLEAPA